ncbi:amidase family protein [Candidatus Saccharibacteria bacterium]|nr:amidase family protein [Candidatus Saccharibacteria bacterium]
MKYALDSGIQKKGDKVDAYEVQKTLEGYHAPITATVVKRLEEAGAELAQHAGYEANMVAVEKGMATFALNTDVGGEVMAAAENGLYGLRPSYGAISRYGMIASASSMDAIGVTAKTPEDIREALMLIAGPDGMDSTVFDDLATGAKSGSMRVRELELDEVRVKTAEVAHMVIRAAETASSYYRYDGIRFGHRAKDAKSLKDLYNKSRAEGLTEDSKKWILFGTYVLLGENIERCLIKAQKVRTMIIEALEKEMVTTEVLSGSDLGVIAALAGLPVVITPEGKQYIGKRKSDLALLQFVADMKEAK